jgi:hypothetical protein
LLDDKKRKRLDEERAILYKKHPKAENTAFDAFYPENYSHRTVDFEPRF